MTRRLERLLKIDELLRRNARQTADTLAAELECSERTVRGELAFLKDRYGAPVEFDQGKGWHYTESNWRLPTVPLTRGELFALTLGARMLSACSGSVYREELEGAIAQLAKRLPEQISVNLQQLAEQNVMFRVGAELALDPEIWQCLEAACQQQRRVHMRYATPGKPVSARAFDPYVLHFSRNNPYVTGWCHRRGEVRWFRVDRIQALELRPETFELDPAFDREAHFADAFQHEVGGVPQPMAIWFDAGTAPYINERRWHPTQQIETHADGSITLRFVVRGLNEVKRWILFYGAGARALEPPELVAMVKAELQGMTEHYNSQNRVSEDLKE